MSGEDETIWGQIPSLNLSMDDDYSERLITKEGRRHHRSGINELNNALYGDISSIPIRIATVAQGIFEGKILDVSASGCRIEVSKDLKEGDLAKVRFEVDKKIILTKAIVRWILLEAKGCIAGLEFKGLSSDQKEFLNIICTATKF